MIHYIQFDLSFDAEQMKKELLSLQSRTWPLHYQKRDYEGTWSALSLRSVDGQEETVFISPVTDPVYQDTDLLRASPCFQQVLQTFHCPIQAVRLLKLSPGSIIKEHKDLELNFENGAFRLHIPVQTNDQVEFKVAGEALTLREGECWYCNFNLPHSIANRGTSDRIHLVIDGLVNDWVKDLFNSDTILRKKEEEEKEPPQNEQTIREMIHHLRSMKTPAGEAIANEMEAKLHASSSKE